MSKQGTKGAKNLTAMIGRRGTLVTAGEGLTVDVCIEDARRCFGRTDEYCVTDRISEGAWIDIRRVILVGREN